MLNIYLLFVSWHQFNTDKFQRKIFNVISPKLASQVHSLIHCRNIVSLSIFYEYIKGNCCTERSSLWIGIYEFKRSTKLAASLIILQFLLLELTSNLLVTVSSMLPVSYFNLFACFFLEGGFNVNLQKCKCNIYHYLVSS